jgi:UDP-perosamine 4-acetyltransferase
MMDTGLILLGGGGHAKVVADAAIAQGHRLDGFLDDRADAALTALEYRHLGALNDWRRFAGRPMFIALGDNALRRRLIDDIHPLAPGSAGGWLSGSESVGSWFGRHPPAEPGAHGLAIIVHPSAVVSPSALIDHGVFIAPGAIVNAGAHVGRGAIVNSGAIVEHDCRIGECAHIAPGAILGGNVTVGPAALIGLGARVLPGVTIGQGAVVGAGAVVIENVSDGATVRGVPARSI